MVNPARIWKRIRVNYPSTFGAVSTPLVDGCLGAKLARLGQAQSNPRRNKPTKIEKSNRSKLFSNDCAWMNISRDGTLEFQYTQDFVGVLADSCKVADLWNWGTQSGITFRSLCIHRVKVKRRNRKHSMFHHVATIIFKDFETSDDAVAIVRRDKDLIEITVSVMRGADIVVVMNKSESSALVEALRVAVSAESSPTETKMQHIATINFKDAVTSIESTAIVRSDKDSIAFSLAVMRRGDVMVVMNKADASALLEALRIATSARTPWGTQRGRE